MWQTTQCKHGLVGALNKIKRNLDQHSEVPIQIEFSALQNQVSFRFPPTPPSTLYIYAHKNVNGKYIYNRFTTK